MDDDGDVVEVDVIEQGGLEQFQALVDQGRGVDRDDAAHVPGGVLHGVGGGDVSQGLPVTAAERTTGGRQDETAHLIASTSAQTLGKGGVLRVDRDDLSGSGRLSDEPATDDQGLLVGQGQGRPGSKGCQGRAQTGSSGDGIADDVSGHPGQLSRSLRTSQDLRIGHRDIAGPGLDSQCSHEFLGCVLPCDRHHGNGEVEYLLGQQANV